MPYITEAQLPELLRSFENGRFAADELGQRPYVDIATAWHQDDEDAPCQYPDCDIRGLTGAGVQRQWDGKLETIRWGLIRTLTIGRYERDAEGWLQYRPRRIYQVISRTQAQQEAA